MKRKFIFVAGAVLVAVAVSVFVYIKNEKKSINELFNANVEALAKEEIIVGNLCMVWHGYTCKSLKEIFFNHYPA